MPRPKSTGLPFEEEEKLRVNKLLDVAAQVFLEAGYGAASTAEIAKRAHTSKQTFYKRFPSKEKLFLAVIDHRTSRIADHISSRFRLDKPVGQVLLEVAREVLSVVLSTEHLALVRLVYMEAPHFPDAARYLIERGPDRGMSNLAKYLEEQTSAGILSIGNAHLAAQQFSGLVMGDLVHRALLGMDMSKSKRMLEARANSGVEAFLHIYEAK